MKATGNVKFEIQAETGETGGIRSQGDYEIAQLGRDTYLKQDFTLEKDDADIVISFGAIATVSFFHVKAVFADNTVTDATVELKINDGSGEISMTGTEFLIADGDYTSMKLTNNSNDTTGSAALIYIDLLGEK